MSEKFWKIISSYWANIGIWQAWSLEDVFWWSWPWSFGEEGSHSHPRSNRSLFQTYVFFSLLFSSYLVFSLSLRFLFYASHIEGGEPLLCKKILCLLATLRCSEAGGAAKLSLLTSRGAIYSGWGVILFYFWGWKWNKKMKFLNSDLTSFLKLIFILFSYFSSFSKDFWGAVYYYFQSHKCRKETIVNSHTLGKIKASERREVDEIK